MLLDLKEAAIRLGINYETARQYVVTGLLRAVRLPSLDRLGESRRKIQIDEVDLEQFIADSKTALQSGTISGPIDDGRPREVTRIQRTTRTKNGRPYEWCK